MLARIKNWFAKPQEEIPEHDKPRYSIKPFGVCGICKIYLGVENIDSVAVLFFNDKTYLRCTGCLTDDQKAISITMKSITRRLKGLDDKK
jgi:hypothetical protein